MRVSGIHHIAVQVQDLERARAFYVEVLGMDEARRQPHSIWLQAQGSDTIVMLEKCDGAGAPPAWVSPQQGLHLVALTIASHERAAWKERLVAHGVAIEKESGFTLYVRDPDGTRVGLSHYPHPAGERA